MIILSFIFLLEATASLNRRQRQHTTDKDPNDFHHPHYTHHRTYSSKAKEHSVSSSAGNTSSNLPYHYGSTYSPSKEMNDQLERSDREFTSTTMQNVIMSTSSRDNTRVTKDISSNRDHKNLSKMSDENAKSSSSSSSVVKRTKNMIISSPTERNSKPPTHETYHIEEML